MADSGGMKTNTIYSGTHAQVAIQCTSNRTGKVCDFLFIGDYATRLEVGPVNADIADICKWIAKTGLWQQVPGSYDYLATKTHEDGQLA